MNKRKLHCTLNVKSDFFDNNTLTILFSIQEVSKVDLESKCVYEKIVYEVGDNFEVDLEIPHLTYDHNEQYILTAHSIQISDSQDRIDFTTEQAYPINFLTKDIELELVKL